MALLKKDKKKKNSLFIESKKGRKLLPKVDIKNTKEGVHFLMSDNMTKTRIFRTSFSQLNINELLKNNNNLFITFSTNKVDDKYINKIHLFDNINKKEKFDENYLEDLEKEALNEVETLSYIASGFSYRDYLGEFQRGETKGFYDELDIIAPELIEINPEYVKMDTKVTKSYTILNCPRELSEIERFMNSNIDKYLSFSFKKVDVHKIIDNLNIYFKNKEEKIKSLGAEHEYQLFKLEKDKNILMDKLEENNDDIYTRSTILTLEAENYEELKKKEEKVRLYFLNNNAIMRSLSINNLKALKTNLLGYEYIDNPGIYILDRNVEIDINKYIDINDSLIDSNRNRLSTQDSVHINEFVEDGLLYLGKNKYSKSFTLKNINFETLDEGEQEKIILKYQEFLNSFSSDIEIYVTINNKKIYKEEFRKEILLKELKVDDGKNHLRKEYNDMLVDKVDNGINSIQRDRYVTLTITAKSIEEAKEQFNTITDMIKRNVKSIGSGEKNNSDISLCNNEERIKLLFNLLNPEKAEFFEYYDFEKMQNEGLSSRDIVAPDYLEFKNKEIIINDYYLRMYFISDLPNMLNPSFFAGINENFNEQIITTASYKTFEPKKAVKMISNQYTNYNGELESINKRARRNSSLLYVPPKLEKALEETKELLDDVTTRDQKMFETTVVVGVFGKTKNELEKNCSLVKNYCDRKMVTLTIAKGMQELAFNSCLPIGVNLLPMKRTLTSEAGSVYFPFKSQNILDTSGMYYGVNPSNKDLIMINRKNFKNGNGFILGKPGGGKSFAAKNEILNTILTTDDDVVIIDPENEYRDLCVSLSGEYIPIDQNSPYHINMFDIEKNDKEDGGIEGSIKEKTSFIKGCMNLMMEQNLTIEESGILDECITDIYKSWFRYVNEQKANGEEVDYNYFPTLSTLRSKLNTLDGREKSDAYSLISALRMYTTGSLNMFDQHTNIDPNNRLVLFSIRGLQNEGVLKKLSMNIIMDQIWQRLIRNGKNGRPTWIYIDEIYLLFDNQSSMSFLRNLWKRARKYNGFPTGITQNVDDLLSIHDARTMLSNADFVMMLTQSSIDRRGLANLYNIGDKLQTYIIDSEPGHGLIHTENGTIPFENKFPKDTKMYEVMTTNPKEKAEILRRKKELANEPGKI